MSEQGGTDVPDQPELHVNHKIKGVKIQLSTQIVPSLHYIIYEKEEMIVVVNAIYAIA